MPPTETPSVPLPPLPAAVCKRIAEFKRIMLDAADLRDRLEEFAASPAGRRAVAALMAEYDARNPQQAEFLDGIARGMTAVVFVLEQFRAAVECDTGHTWLD